MYTLNGWNRKDELEQFFTDEEGETAVAIAQIWQRLGWKPRLKSYIGGVHIVNPIPLCKAA
jgi:hypothetical protein